MMTILFKYCGREVYGNQPLQRGKHPASRALEKEIKRELSAIDNDSGGNRHKDKVGHMV